MATARIAGRYVYPYGGMNAPEPWGPHPKQAVAHRQVAKEIMFGGAAGPGKTDWLLAQGLRLCWKYPGFPALILRRTFKHLAQEGGIIERLRTRIPLSVGRYNAGEHVWTFRNGSRLQLGYLFSDADIERYIGAEFGFIGWDQVEQFTSFQYTRMFHPLRLPEHHPAVLDGYLPHMGCTANPGGCVREGDVLTPDGWRPIETMRAGDPVMSVDADGELVERRVADVVRLDWDGDLVEVNARGLFMEVTPDHRVAKVGGTRHEQGRRFSLVPFDELPGRATVLRSVSWRGVPLGDVTPTVIPTRKRKLRQPLSLPGPTYMALLGWVLSEGCIVARDRAVNIAQMKPASRGRLAELLEHECGFSVRWSSLGAIIYAADWAAHFAPLGKCRDKYIPAAAKNAIPAELARLFATLMDGDGHWESPDSGAYYTASRQLADDVAEVALKLGYLVSISTRQRVERVGPSFAVNVKRTRAAGTELVTTGTARRSDIRRFHYQGPVWCLRIPGTETFVIRQHGSAWISGNSGHMWVKARWVDEAPPMVVWQPAPTEAEPEPGTRVYVPATLADNPSMPIWYRRQLEAIPDEHLRRALIDGDWNVYAGARFGHLWRPRIHVVEPEDWPVAEGAGVPRGLACDYGLEHPWCALWGAVFSDGLVVVYRELLASGLTPRQQAEQIRTVEQRAGERQPGRPMPTALSPDAWRRDPSEASTASRVKAANVTRVGSVKSGPPKGSIAWHYHQAGIPAVRANDDRLSGTMLIADKLGVRKDGRPRLYVHSTCLQLIKTIPAIPRDKANPELYQKQDGDDPLDTLRYLLQLIAPGDFTPPPGDGWTPGPGDRGGVAADTAGWRTRPM